MEPDEEDLYCSNLRSMMNVHSLDTGLRAAVRKVEARHPLKVIGVLPRGSAVHVEDAALDLLAKKRLGLSLFTVAQAEAELSELLGRPVGIVLTSEVHGAEAERLSAAAKPL